MADEMTKAEDAATGQPELVDVVFNNQTVQVTKAHAELLREAERSLKQASNQKFEEAARLKKENEVLVAAMEEDAKWLNEHDPEEYKYYEMKSRGGKGYVGTNTTVNPAMSGDIYNPDSDVKSNAEIDSLKAEIKDLKNLISNVVEKDEKKEVQAALEAKNDLLKQRKEKVGSPVDQILTGQLKAFHADNHRAPTPNEVNEIVTNVYNAFGRKGETPPPPPTTPVTGLPKAGGNIPTSSDNEKLDFKGIDGVNKFAQALSKTMSGAR